MKTLTGQGVSISRCSTSGVLKIGEDPTHWSVTQATVSLSSAEAESRGNHERFCGRYIRVECVGRLTGATNRLEIWTGRLECAIFTGRRANRLKVQTMWVQHMSNEDILKVHKKHAKNMSQMC